MPLQKIKVGSQSNKKSEMDAGQTEGVTVVTINMDTMEAAASAGLESGKVKQAESCDSNVSSDGNLDTVEEVSVDLDCDVQRPHVEADTVIIGDTNSDSLSYDTSRPADVRATDRSDSDPPSHVTTDISISSNVTTTDKRTNSRSTGKTSKKEKPTPVRKKDSETQETLHPNSPTPISAERCDSSLSNVDVCRICQCDSCEIQKDSPLVAPCLCSGSLKYVHQACLQKWIKSSDKLSCELCQFDYKMTKKTKPFREWERLDMTPQERRKVVCSVTFHVIAITCVVWSLYVLIDRTTEEVEAGSLLWPFWTKLIVVAIGFTGGVVFMYVQCKMYLTLCKKWRMYNKVILISSIPESQRLKANHEGIMKISEKQAQLMDENHIPNFEVFTIVHEPDNASA